MLPDPSKEWAGPQTDLFSEQVKDSRLAINQTGFNLTSFVDERQRILGVMECANRIASALTVEGMISQAIELMAAVTGAEFAAFFQPDANTDELVLTAVHNDPNGQRLLGLRLKRQGSLLELSTPGARPVIVGDLVADSHWLQLVNPQSAWKAHNMIGLPLEAENQIIGVIQIYNFNDAELDLLSVIGQRLAGEIANRSHLQDARRANERLTTLIDIIGELSGTLDRRYLLHRVAEQASHLVDAERSTVFLIDPSSDEMLFQVAYQNQQARPEQGIPETPESSDERSASGKTTQRRKETPGTFNFLTRSAVTVPITTSQTRLPHTGQSNILGGLMVLNKHGEAFQEEDARLLGILADQASNFLQVAEVYESAGELFLDLIKALVTAIDAKDPYTQGHSQRVSDYSVMIAEELGLNEPQINDIRISSLLHDIGKIGIPDAILQKEGSLTAAEYRIVKAHPRTGANILRQVKMLDAVVPGILQHHEQLNGEGYPGGLCGDEISLMGRIIAVADVFDAMTSDRPYRKAIKTPDVIDYLKENAGILFDPNCVRILTNRISRTTNIYE